MKSQCAVLSKLAASPNCIAKFVETTNCTCKKFKFILTTATSTYGDINYDLSSKVYTEVDNIVLYCIFPGILLHRKSLYRPLTEIFRNLYEMVVPLGICFRSQKGNFSVCVSLLYTVYNRCNRFHWWSEYSWRHFKSRIMAGFLDNESTLDTHSRVV